MKIYNLGSLNIDYVYKVDHFVMAGETLSSESMSVFPGGKGLNQSVALARAGADVIHGNILGSEGDFLIDVMKDSKVDTTRIKRVDSPCGHAIIQVDKNGNNCILLFSGTNFLVDEKYISEFLSDAEEGDFLVLQNEISALDVIFETAHKKGMQIVFNPSPFNPKILSLPLSYVKWWFCNEIEASSLFNSKNPKTICENFVSLYPESNLILTLGGAGSVFANAKEYIECKAYGGKPVDTTAAGDTFTGYFIFAISKGKSPKEALTLASKASGITISKAGASESIPYMDMIK